MQELDDYINKVQHLPPAPRILPQLLTLLKRDDVDASQVVDVMKYDASLTTAALQLCNSAAFSGKTRATDLQQAVARLGFDRIYRLVAAVSGAQTFSPTQKGYGIDGAELWKHSVTAAVAGQMVARKVGDDENLVFTCALLHDIGKVVLAQSLQRLYENLIKEADKTQQSLLEAEKRALSVQHAEIGARLLSRWEFPANIVDAVAFHHTPAAASAQHQRLAAQVYVANMIAYFIGHGFGQHAFAMRGRVEALAILGFEADELPQLMMKTYDHLAVVNSLLTARG